MEEKATLSDEISELEHKNVQLALETETIGRFTLLLFLVHLLQPQINYNVEWQVDAFKSIMLEMTRDRKLVLVFISRRFGVFMMLISSESKVNK